MQNGAFLAAQDWNPKGFQTLGMSWVFNPDTQMTIRGSPNGHSGIPEWLFGDTQMTIWGSHYIHLGIPK